jgi:hypothetical protein
MWPSLTNITLWQLLIFLTVICGRFEDMDLPCRMHQSCTSHDSLLLPRTKAFHVLLFFFLSRCSQLFSCSTCLTFVLLQLRMSVFLYSFFPSCSLSSSVLLLFLNLSCSSYIIFPSLLLYIFSLSCSISSFCLASVLHSRLTRLIFSFSPPLSPISFHFLKIYVSLLNF